MDALLAIEAHRQRDPARSRETRGIRVAGIRPVEAAQIVDARGGDDRLHNRMPAMAWINLVVLVRLANRRRRHPHRGGVVASAEDQRLEALRSTGNLDGIDEPARRFNLRL